jgi:hypothetical protein
MTISNYHCQGTLDGLCGQYAVVNAFTACGALKTYGEQQALLDTLNKALPKKRWPAAVMAGTSFDDLRKMVRAAQRAQRAQRARGIKVTYPFFEATKPKRDPKQYLGQLLELLPTAGKGCAIIVVERPHDAWIEHWIVVRRRGRAFEFIDSEKQRGRTMIVKKASNLRVGRHKGNDAHWHILAKEQVIVFTR